MPSRQMQDAVWTSKRLESVPEKYRALYAWIHPAADAWGIMEADSRLLAIRCFATLFPSFGKTKVDELLKALAKAYLLFFWKQDGKEFAYWTNSERDGRLPDRSRRWREYKTNNGVLVPWVKMNAWLVAGGQQPEERPGWYPSGTNVARDWGKRGPSLAQDRDIPVAVLAQTCATDLPTQPDSNPTPTPTQENQSSKIRKNPADPLTWLDFQGRAAVIFQEVTGQDPRWTHESYRGLEALIESGVKSGKPITISEFERNYRNFLASEEPFHAEKRASLKWFVTGDRFGMFAAGPIKANGQTVIAKPKPAVIPPRPPCDCDDGWFEVLPRRPGMQKQFDRCKKCAVPSVTA